MASEFNIASAHRLFAVECFNRAWELIEKPERSPVDDEQMILLSLASLWHWTQREDRTPRSLSIGHWQASRVYCLLGQPDNASRHGEACLRHAENEPPFYRAYAHEALARAASVGDDTAAVSRHFAQAQALAAEVADPEERRMVERDLEGISVAYASDADD